MQNNFQITFVEMWKFQNDSDKFITRGSVLNGVAPMVKNLFSAKSFIILDKNNKLIYASTYRDAKEISEIANKLQNAYVIK